MCTFPVSATDFLPDAPDPVTGVLTAIFMLIFLLAFACVGAAVFGAVVAGIYLLLERLPMPRVRAALPTVVLVFIAGAALAGTWGKYSVPFPFSLLPLAMAVLMPWPLVASRFGAGRRSWLLVLIAAPTTALLASPLHFFPFVSGPGQTSSIFPGQVDMFLEIGEMVCIACLVWAVMLLLGHLREGERVFLLAPLLALVWIIPTGALSSVFPEGALIAGGVASMLLLATAPLSGRRRAGALVLVVAATLVVVSGYPLLLVPGGEWADLSVALFIVLMLALGTVVGLLLARPASPPWCMGAAFAAPLLVTLGYRLVGGSRNEVWSMVGSSVISLLGLCAVSTIAAVAVGGLLRWMERGKIDRAPLLAWRRR